MYTRHHAIKENNQQLRHPANNQLPHNTKLTSPLHLPQARTQTKISKQIQVITKNPQEDRGRTKKQRHFAILHTTYHHLILLNVLHKTNFSVSRFIRIYWNDFFRFQRNKQHDVIYFLCHKTSLLKSSQIQSTTLVYSQDYNRD